jgi:hypothetical protein
MLKALNLVELPKSWNTKTKFKIRLGLERNDKVHVDKISIIEEALNININITRDIFFK